MSRILLAAACDRFNFGDLLFPRVVGAALRRRGLAVDEVALATRAADLRAVGGVASRPLEALLHRRPEPGDALVLAGGEVLDARWSDTCAAHLPPAAAFGLKAAAKISRGAGDWLGRRLLGCRRFAPWVLGAAELGPQARVAYCAVGGSGLDQLPPRLQRGVRQRLGEALDLSVRDARTREILASWGIAARLAPDAAALVAELFPAPALFEAASAPARELLSELGPRGYVVLQLGRYPARGQLATIARELRLLHAASGLPLVFLPLGQAAAHEDGRPLGELARALPGLPITFLPAPGVDDLLLLLAHARLFLGTSLHGNLVSLAFGVPHVGLGPEVRKLAAFLATWAPRHGPRAAPFPELGKAALAALAADPAPLEQARNHLRSAAAANLDRLAAVLGSRNSP